MASVSVETLVDRLAMVPTVVLLLPSRVPVVVTTRRRSKRCERKAAGGWDSILPVLPRCFRLVGLWPPLVPVPLPLVVEDMFVGVLPVLFFSNKSSVPIPWMTMQVSHPTATQQLLLRLGLVLMSPLPTR